MHIDVHTHAFHPKIASKVVGQLNNHYGIDPVGDGTLDDLLAREKAAGMDKVVLFNAATSPDQVIPANTWAINLQREHPEVVSFGTLHPDYPGNQEEIARLQQNGIKGLKFHPDFQGFFLDSPAFYALMELIPDDFTLMIHIGDTLPPEQNPSCPYKMKALRRLFPGPRLIAPHFGGYLHWEHVVSTLCGEDIWIDTSSALSFMDPAQIKAILNAHPLDRFLFGSDYPLFDPGQEAERLGRVAGLSDSQVEQVLSNGTALLSD